MALALQKEDQLKLLQALRATVVSNSRRPAVSGKSMMLGWTDIITKRRISQNTLKNREFQETANGILKKYCPSTAGAA